MGGEHMDDNFLERANQVKLRLEAEGMHQTAIAIEYVIQDYKNSLNAKEGQVHTTISQIQRYS